MSVPTETEGSESNPFVNCENGLHPVPLEQAFQFPGDLLFMRYDRSEILSLNGETHKFTSVFRMPGNDIYDVSPLSQDGKTLVISYRKPSDRKVLLLIRVVPE
ncbi:MAG TPA: hypothetical protein VK145_00765 [Candidatus Nanoarchaeia archaeon]|nr:hypothetical protein [Candidatus Nanoarchaeia archaeon]